MPGWVWIEGTINASPKEVFDYFADDSDKLSYLMPSARVVKVLERTALPNGGRRVRLILNLGGREHDVVSVDTEYQPYTLLRGRSWGPTGTIETEKKFSESNGRTRIVWRYRVAERKGLMSRLNGALMPSYLRLSARLGLLGILARARAALEPVPQPQPVTEPTWVGVHMPTPVGVRFGWVTSAIWGIALVAVVADGMFASLMALDWRVVLAGLVPTMVVLMILVDALAWLALRILPNRLPDT